LVAGINIMRSINTCFMKRYFHTLLILLGCGTACNVLDTDQNPNANAVFYATLEDAGIQQETKVYADADLKVLWNQGDRVSVFNKRTGNEEYGFDGNDGEDSGSFHRIGEEKSGSTLSHIYAVYPYSDNTSIGSQGIVSFTLPSVQTYSQDSFGAGSNTMISVTDDDQLQFYNVCGYLGLKLCGPGISISKITLQSNKAEKIAGEAKITISSGETPSVAMTESASDVIDLVCDPPVQLDANRNKFTTFWFVIPPTIFTEGFTVSIAVNQGDTYEKSTTKTVTISRNTLVRMATLELSQNGISIYKYGDDSNWDNNSGSGGNFDNGGYGGDSNWDNNSGSGGNFNNGGYGGDTNWDNNSSSGGNFSNGGYGGDSNWSQDGNGNANVGKSGYGKDSDWDSDDDSGGGVGIDGYGGDIDWD